MEDINREMGTAIVIVTHDLALAGDFCDNIADVRRADRGVGPAEAIMEDPLHPPPRASLDATLGSRHRCARYRGGARSHFGELWLRFRSQVPAAN